MKAILMSYGYLVTGPDDVVEWIGDKSKLAEVQERLAKLHGFDPDDYSAGEVFMKAWTHEPGKTLEERMEEMTVLMRSRDWDKKFNQQAVAEHNRQEIEMKTEQPSSLNKAVIDWGYRHSLMLTQAQVDDLMKTIAGAPDQLWGLPAINAKHAGWPK